MAGGRSTFLTGTALRAAAVMLAAAAPAPAFASESGELQAQMKRLEQEIADQRALIAAQAARIDDQQKQIDSLKAGLGFNLNDIRGRGLGQAATGTAPGSSAAVASAEPAAPPPEGPVGEAPPEQDTIQEAQVQAIPQESGVLTPAGKLIFDPSIEYTHASENRLVFRGIELIPGIQLGLIEASDVDSDTLVGTASLRYGMTNRLELEARVPYLYRNDRIQVVQQRDEGIVRTIHLRGDGFGDAELALRYQLNKVKPLNPIWIASLRVKSDTGRGPFEIPFDEFGVATGLATGSGFWGVQPGINFLLPSDPVVIYGGASYLYHIARDIDRTVGDVRIGRVDPGDAITVNVGFGFALNPRFSYSLGYQHNYIFPTTSELGDTIQRSSKLQVGVLNLGMSYRVTEKKTLNLGFQFGVTHDAPDVTITLRSPFGLID
ncbi:MAG TPA: transporter [Sphingomicrobium sp.]|nr:transporter [Sphingomicrobium sp.]